MTSSIAQLRNVSALTTLVEKLISAPIGQERMGCFYGPSGWGKTTSVSAAELIYGVIAIEVIENTSKLDVLRQIQEPLGITSRSDVPSRVRAVAKYMRETDRPLIIDDAQYLVKRKMIGIARDIYKSAGGMVPVILVGEEQLPQALTTIENLYNLVVDWVPAQPCELDDAHRIAEIYAEGIEIAPDLMGEIVVKADGSIRRVSNMLGKAREMARTKGQAYLSMEDWGDTPFFDGQPPAERKVSELKPKIKLVQTSSRRKAAGQ
ncbi:MAG: AAA family ATPase [Pelagimonas sp.]|uniref:AAA family ATPase n=1 Tax=Pelagimonas sp. TaxID=2073170 RepID=UPI003D6BDADA